MILGDVIEVLERGRSPLLLTERKDHLEFFEQRLTGVARNLIVLQGGMRQKKGGKFSPASMRSPMTKSG